LLALETEAIEVGVIAEKYRTIAADCEKRAAETRDPMVRDQFTELARRWRGLADEAAHVEAIQEPANRALAHRSNGLTE
jgi:hypothetical protein